MEAPPSGESRFTSNGFIIYHCFMHNYMFDKTTKLYGTAFKFIAEVNFCAVVMNNSSH